MLDNQLISLIISTIIAQEAGAGIPGTSIKQAFQPTQQGVNTAPTAYMYKIGDKRIGLPQRSDIWRPDDPADPQGPGIMIHTEMQQYQTIFQISALSTQDPANTTQKTASDILNLIAYILQSSPTIQILADQGIGILNVMDVRNPYFEDDRQRNEASPSFDFILTHMQVVSTIGQEIDEVEFNILTV